MTVANNVIVMDDLDTIADEIRREVERGRSAVTTAYESYFVIGRCLDRARAMMPSNNEYGEWFQAQNFGFTQQWARVLSAGIENEKSVRDALQSQLCNGRQPNFEKAVNEARVTPPEPAEDAKPRRKSLTMQASDAAWALRKAVERLERIFADDRFIANKEQVAAHTRGHLTYAVEVCQDLTDRFDHLSKENQ